ncbi:MAG: zinc ribbon domain-containing protein [Peptococcaceae bacterium]|nr:zinc ribbon domain-containing protein [Peptococcaceae bacterium]
MPTYDFKCENCDHKFTIKCSMDDRDKQTCPSCGSSNITQRLTSINIGRSTNSGSNNIESGGSCSSCCLGDSGFGCAMRNNYH